MIEIIRIVDEVAVVTATADFHPLRQLKKLTEELRSLRFEGLVLFDLLAVNGLESNRFSSMRFIANIFVKSSFAIETNVNLSIRCEQNSLARGDQNFLLGSVLSTSELERLAH